MADEPKVTFVAEDIVGQLADITGLLLHHAQAPLVETEFIRGVLPAPAPAQAVRIVTGARTGTTDNPNELLAYEIPLRADDHDMTARDIIGVLRSLHTSAGFYSSDQISTVLGITLIQVDLAAVEPADPTAEDKAFTLLRTLAGPLTEQEPDPVLLGFLFLSADRLRLYLTTEDVPEVIAADVNPSGAVTALLAALPSLLTEQGRTTRDGTDPHCSRIVDLTDW